MSILRSDVVIMATLLRGPGTVREIQARLNKAGLADAVMEYRLVKMRVGRLRTEDKIVVASRELRPSGGKHKGRGVMTLHAVYALSPEGERLALEYRHGIASLFWG